MSNASPASRQRTIRSQSIVSARQKVLGCTALFGMTLVFLTVRMVNMTLELTTHTYDAFASAQTACSSIAFVIAMVLMVSARLKYAELLASRS